MTSQKTSAILASANMNSGRESAGSAMQSILNRMDAADLEAAKSPLTPGHRTPYRRSDVSIVVEHPGGGVTKSIVTSRGISSTSVSLIGCIFVHTGSRIVISVKRRDGGTDHLLGAVASCRLVVGRLHEVIVRLANRLDPLGLAPSEELPENLRQPAHGIADLRGRVLYLDDCHMDHLLLKQCLKASSVELVCVTTMAEAKAELAGKTFDICIFDFWLEEGNTVDLIRQVRADGYAGPILSLTAESASDQLAALQASGASKTVSKPFRADEMLNVLIDLHVAAGAVLPAESLVSTMEDDDTVGPTLPAYIDFARQQADKLDAALRSGDVAAARLTCLNIKGSAPGYGFMAMAEAAKSGVKALDATNSVGESRGAIRHLELMARNLHVRSEAELKAAATERMAG